MSIIPLVLETPRRGRESFLETQHRPLLMGIGGIFGRTKSAIFESEDVLCLFADGAYIMMATFRADCPVSKLDFQTSRKLGFVEVRAVGQGACLDGSSFFCPNDGVKCDDCGKTFKPDGSATGWKNGYPKNWTEKQKEEDYRELHGSFCSVCRNKYQNQHPWDKLPLIEDALRNTLDDIGDPADWDPGSAPGGASSLVEHDGYVTDHRQFMNEINLTTIYRVGHALEAHHVPPLPSGPKPKKPKLSEVRTDTEEEPYTWIKFQETIREVYGKNRGRQFESEARTIGKLTPKEFKGWIKKQKSSSTRQDKGLTFNALLEFAKEETTRKISRKHKKHVAETIKQLEEEARKANKAGGPLGDFPVWVPLLHPGNFQKMPLTEKLSAIVCDPPYREEDNKKDDWKLYEDLAIFADKHLKPNRPLILMVGQRPMTKIIQKVEETKRFKLYWVCCAIYDGYHLIKFKAVNSHWKPILVFIRTGDKLWKFDNLKRYINEDVFKSGPFIDRESQVHTDQQDPETFRKIIAQFTSLGELVCDPCFGSGTTGIACLTIVDEEGKLQRRKFCGAENSDAGTKTGDDTFKDGSDRIKGVYTGELTRDGEAIKPAQEDKAASTKQKQGRSS